MKCQGVHELGVKCVCSNRFPFSPLTVVLRHNPGLTEAWGNGSGSGRTCVLRMFTAWVCGAVGVEGCGGTVLGYRCAWTTVGTCRGRPGSDLSGPQFLNGEQSYKVALTNFLEMQLMMLNGLSHHRARWSVRFLALARR